MTSLTRKAILDRHPWLKDRRRPMVISTGLDGLLAAAFLHHHLEWQVAGYYDGASLWLSDEALENRERLVWVDLDICRPKTRSLGHHILTPTGNIPSALGHICNPNLLAGIGADSRADHYPFSTIIFLLWLHNNRLQRNLVARLLVLHAEAVWMNLQHEAENCIQWQARLPGYDWPWLFSKVDTELFERRMQDQLYVPLQRLVSLEMSGRGRSRHLQLQNGQLRFNPDWDEDIFLKLGGFIGTHLKWSPPHPPVLTRRIDAQLKTAPLQSFRDKDFPTSLIHNGVFSYTIFPPNKVNFALINF